MSMLEQFGRQIPDPYPYMYLDGYKPHEILQATSRKMYTDYLERKEEASIPTINFKTTVRIK